MNDPKTTATNAKKKKFATNPVWELINSPTYWPVAAFEWIVAWGYTRRWLPLLAITPVLVSIFYVHLLAARGQKRSRVEIAARYVSLVEEIEKNSKKIENAVKEGNTVPELSEKELRVQERAKDLYCRRAIAGDLEDSTRYLFSKYLYQLNRKEEADAQFAKLAPENRVGYGLAHLEVLRALWEEGFTRNLKRFRHHSDAALLSVKEDGRTYWFAAQVSIYDKKYEEACAHLEKAIQYNPNYLMALAPIYAQLGMQAQYQNTIERATKYYVSELEKDAKKDEARLGLVQCKLWALKFPDAVAVAEEGFRFQPDSLQMKVLVIMAHLAIFDHLSSEATNDSKNPKAEPKIDPQAIRSLDRILNLDPSSIEALTRIAKLVTNWPEKDWGSFKKTLEEALATGTATPTVHVILAEGYLNRKEFDRAKVHLELAYSQNPKMLTVLNNLAWVEAHNEPPNLTRAKELIDQAIVVAPNHPEVLETQGVIYFKGKEYSECIKTLEKLLDVFPDRAELRTMLSESYQHLGLETLAEEYRKKAQAIEKRIKQ